MKMRDIMRLVEGAGIEFDGFLYHAAPSRLVDEIRANGVKPGYWGTAEIASYIAEDIEDHGEESHIFKVPLEAFSQEYLEPDQPGIDEPLTYTLGMKEYEVQEMWENSDQTWRDSLDIVGSVRYNAAIPPSSLIDA